VNVAGVFKSSSGGDTRRRNVAPCVMAPSADSRSSVVDVGGLNRRHAAGDNVVDRLDTGDASASRREQASSADMSDDGTANIIVSSTDSAHVLRLRTGSVWTGY